MWFDSWSDVLRVLLVGTAAYATLVVVIRIAGKRTLSQFNAFDFVVTVAFGSTVATILLGSDVSFAEGAAALLILAALQFVVALAGSRARWMQRLVSAEPTVLVRDGRVLEDALRRRRVSPDDLRQAIRSSGSGSVSTVAVAVLEPNGTISVVATDRLGDGSALRGIPDSEREP